MSRQLAEAMQACVESLRRLADRMDDEAPGVDAPTPTGGSGGDAEDGVSAHQPTPEVGDVWDYYGHRLGVAALSESHVETVCLTCLPDEGSSLRIARALTGRGRLVERGGKPWSPAAEQEPAGVRPRKGEVWQDDGGLRVRRHRVAPMWLLEDAVVRLRAALDGEGVS